MLSSVIFCFVFRSHFQCPSCLFLSLTALRNFRSSLSLFESCIRRWARCSLRRAILPTICHLWFSPRLHHWNRGLCLTLPAPMFYYPWGGWKRVVASFLVRFYSWGWPKLHGFTPHHIILPSVTSRSSTNISDGMDVCILVATSLSRFFQEGYVYQPAVASKEPQAAHR